MQRKKVVPVVITQSKGDVDIVSAFEIAQRAEESKINGWAHSFDFELAEPIVLDLSSGLASERLVDEILANVKRSDSDGIVAASTEFLRRARIYNELPDALMKVGKLIWIADLGSLPLGERVSA